MSTQLESDLREVLTELLFEYTEDRNFVELAAEYLKSKDLRESVAEMDLMIERCREILERTE